MKWERGDLWEFLEQPVYEKRNHKQRHTLGESRKPKGTLAKGRIASHDIIWEWWYQACDAGLITQSLRSHWWARLWLSWKWVTWVSFPNSRPAWIGVFFFFFAGILFDTLGFSHSRILSIIPLKLDIKTVTGCQQVYLLRTRTLRQIFTLFTTLYYVFYRKNSILRSIKFIWHL